MATNGEESIRAVSNIFSQLADDGGAAADSFAAVDKVLKNNVQRNLGRFNKVVNDLTRSLQQQNRRLIENAKSISKSTESIQQRRTTTRTKPFSEPQQRRVKETIGTQSREAKSIVNVGNLIEGDLVNALERLVPGFGKLLDTVSNVAQFLASIKNIKAATIVSDKLNALKAGPKTKGTPVPDTDIPPAGSEAEPKKDTVKSSGMFDGLKKFLTSNLFTRLAQLTLAIAAFATVTTLAVMAIKEFAMSSIPKFFDYLLNPIKEVYGFITGPLNSAFSKLTSFVSKLNPAYGEMASRALDDLQAVIGKLVLPIFMVFLETIKVFTSTLYKNLSALSPAINKAAKALAQLGGGLIAVFMNVLQSSIPVIEAFVAAFENNLPAILSAFQSVANTVMSQMPMLTNIIQNLGPLIQMYLVTMMRQFARDADLAAQAARNNAEAMALNGEAALNVTDVWGQFMYALNTSIMTFGRGLNYVVASFSEFIESLMDLIPGREANIYTAAGRQKIREREAEQEARLNAADKEQGEGDFGGIQIPGQDIGAAPPDAVKEGFAARGAQFQEIGALGKNLQQAAFGGGVKPEEEQVGLQKMIVDMMQQMIGNQNQFDGAIPAQGVR